MLCERCFHVKIYVPHFITYNISGVPHSPGVCSVNVQAARTKQNFTKFHSVYDLRRKTAMAALKTIVGWIGIVLIVSNLCVRQLF